MGEARADYIDMVLEQGEPRSGRRKPTRPTTSTSSMSTGVWRSYSPPDVDVTEQEGLFNSYRTAREIRRDRWMYRQHQAELEAVFKEFDEAADEVYDKSEDLARLVGWRVLAGDLLDYVRFRAVCSDWRSATVSPHGHGITDPRFHPRRWMLLPEGHGLHPAGKKRFFNLSTGLFVRHRVPLLVDHLVLCPVDGLLLLQGEHGEGNTLLLLHPFTGDVAVLPSVTSLKKSLRAHLNPHGKYAWLVDVMASLSVSADGIPMIMIAILDFSCVVCATTKDDHWSVLASWSFIPQGRPMSSRGSIYILQCSTGDSELQILGIDPAQYGSGLRPQPPRLIATCPPGTIYPPRHLVECDSEILLVGYTNYTISSRMLVYRVADLIQGSVVPLTSIQGNALLVRFGWSLSVSFKAMPTVVGDTIVGMYHDGMNT
uniref:KIB1-4 beta-propeller domain-containing protein n=1 Tax=Aegilops tauschii TaxID=37682 RepID=R7WCT7_AEGTA